MWTSKGRSGYGDSTLQGDYDSWSGISPNGRQYRNEATMETRDLSGADYWQLRKQNRPTEEIPASLHMLKNGMANIGAYADKPAVKVKKPSRSIFDTICPQQKRLSTLQTQLKELEKQRNTVDDETYFEYRAVLLRKITRQKVLVNKVMGWDTTRENSQDESCYFFGKTTPESCETDVGCVGVSSYENTSKIDVKSWKEDLTRFIAYGIFLFTGTGIVSQLFF